MHFKLNPIISQTGYHLLALNRNYHSLSLECTRFKESQYDTCFEDFVKKELFIVISNYHKPLRFRVKKYQKTTALIHFSVRCPPCLGKVILKPNNKESPENYI